VSRRRELVASLLQRGWEKIGELGAVSPHGARARRFRRFGPGSMIVFPTTTLYGERWMEVGRETMIGAHIVLSAGWGPGHDPLSDPAIRIGDRCLIGRGCGIVAHQSIDIGDDVWTGHHVFITDMNHGYEQLDVPISLQMQDARPVRIGSGSWLGHGTVVLPGACIGRHVAVAAGSVVAGALPDFSVAAGNPARVVRRYVEGRGWQRVGEDGGE
jgi:carbonic anhydrase/acetyltransferase-like protein (isoleucine patch superfamily)